VYFNAFAVESTRSAISIFFALRFGVEYHL